MTKKEIAILSFKVLSIYSAIQGLTVLPNVLFSISKNTLNDSTYVLFKAAPPLLLIICGALLWYGAPLLASSIFRATVSENGPGASLQDIQVVAFSVVGLVLLSYALPDLVNYVMFKVFAPFGGGKSALFYWIVLTSLKIVLGLWLLFGSRGLVNFINSMRRD